MIALLSSLALAAPCLDDAMAEGPVTAGLLDGDLGRGRRACPREEIAVGVGGLLAVDTPNFYGHLLGSLVVDGSWRLDERTEVFGLVEAVRYDSVISALTSTYLGVGHTALGAGRVLIAGDAGVLSLNGKVVLPTAVGLYRNSWPFAWDLGLSGVVALSDAVRLHGQLGGLASAAASKGPTQGRVGAFTTAGAELRLGTAFAIVGDVVGGFGYTAPVDVVAAGLGLRFANRKRWGLELGGTVPFAGRERAAATVDLRTTARFE